MGKTAAARAFRRLGVPVHDADGAVHRLLGCGGAAVAAVGAAFPDVIRNGAVDRAELGRRVFADPAALRRLETILHPLVRASEEAFLRRASAAGHRLVVLDVPLLFETGGEARCDGVVVVSAPARIQEARVLKRSGMTRERLRAILDRQLGDAEKRRRADFVVPTALGRSFSLRCIVNVVKVARAWRGDHWPPRRRRPRRGAGRRRSLKRLVLGSIGKPDHA
jgi:dephospho-CoA kinase